MQENVQFRYASKVIGWIHLIVSIFQFTVGIIIAGLIAYSISHPGIFGRRYAAYLDQGLFGLIYYILGNCVICVDVWVALGLIDATDTERSISEAIPLAKRWRLWFVFSTVGYVIVAFIINPFLIALIGAGITVMVKGLICFVVHRYIECLEKAGVLCTKIGSDLAYA